MQTSLQCLSMPTWEQSWFACEGAKAVCALECWAAASLCATYAILWCRSPQGRRALMADACRRALVADACRHALMADAHRRALMADARRRALLADAHRRALMVDAHSCKRAHTKILGCAQANARLKMHVSTRAHTRTCAKACAHARMSASTLAPCSQGIGEDTPERPRPCAPDAAPLSIAQPLQQVSACVCMCARTCVRVCVRECGCGCAHG